MMVCRRAIPPTQEIQSPARHARALYLPAAQLHLLARLRDPERNARRVRVVELVLGLNPDMEGDTTALHVAEEAKRLGIRTTRLARGLPSGSQIEYASRAVLADAITERRPLE